MTEEESILLVWRALERYKTLLVSLESLESVGKGDSQEDWSELSERFHDLERSVKNNDLRGFSLPAPHMEKLKVIVERNQSMQRRMRSKMDLLKSEQAVLAKARRNLSRFRSFHNRKGFMQTSA